MALHERLGLRLSPYPLSHDSLQQPSTWIIKLEDAFDPNLGVRGTQRGEGLEEK